MDTLDIKIRISALDDDQTIDCFLMSVLLSTTKNCIYVMRGRGQLPPSLGGAFGKKLVWRLGTVREWIKEQEISQFGGLRATRSGRPQN
jgi:hypothetical protein